MCDSRLSTGDKLLACLLVPFYPIILPFWIPFSYYADYRAEKLLNNEEEMIIEVVMMVSKKATITLKLINIIIKK